MLSKNIAQEKVARKKITRGVALASLLAIGAVALTACVDHRPLRTEVYDENVYLPKDFLTRENPNRPETGDTSWLYYAILTKVSVPGDFGAPYVGYPSGPRHVRFRFSHDKLEMVDDTNYVPTGGDSSAVDAVLNSWPGEHVDVQMKVNLDGEITNVKEENKERPWQERQQFKIDFTKPAIKDMNMLLWWLEAYGVGECLELKSVSLVPGSVKIEQNAAKDGDKKGDDFVSWTTAVTYAMKVLEGGYVYNQCYSQLQALTDRSTFTFHIKQSLWRLPKSEYQPKEVDEKDPMRKVVGLIDTSYTPDLYLDKKTDLYGARAYLIRFDPNKEHTFYFASNFPEEYKEHFHTELAAQVNGIMEDVGAGMRIKFADWNDGGIEREYGDPRYSWIAFHKVPGAAMPIGMATWVYDPRTGEAFSSYLNMYDWIDRYYAMLTQDYLAQVSHDVFGEEDQLPKGCKPGDLIKPDPAKMRANYENTSLYSKLESYMGEAPEEWIKERSDDFRKYMRMLLPDLRFAYPGYNRYVRARSLISELKDARAKDAQFRDLTAQIDRGENPLGTMEVGSPQAIERGLELIRQTKELARNHRKLEVLEHALHKRHGVCTIEGWELTRAMARQARMCKSNGQWETREEWAQRIVDGYFKIFMTHEFGHDLGLAHNFYGNIDTAHMDDNSLTSSVMEYAYTLAEGAEAPKFKPWDVMSLKWIYGGKEPGKDENWLYCSDEHADLSPLCTRHDIGTTPTEIVKNVIDQYEWQYHFRNFRAYRKLWDTTGYYSTMFRTLYPLRRFLHLWGINWYSVGIENNLRLLGVQGDQQFFDKVTDEFTDEMAQANRLIGNFHKAILQQSAGERSYATKFDNFYGDITQQGIILDKYFAMFFHLGLWPVDDYDQNIYAYIAYHEYNFNSLFYSDMQDITDSMLGGQYDVYPWFKPTAMLLFAQDTHDINFSDRAKQRWIEMRKYERVQDMIDVFGFDPRTQALTVDNPYQYFRDNLGKEWIYYYLADRNQHLVASKDYNPIAFKLLKDQNEDININKSGTADDFEIKYVLDYYQYFN